MPSICLQLPKNLHVRCNGGPKSAPTKISLTSIFAKKQRLKGILIPFIL